MKQNPCKIIASLGFSLLLAAPLATAFEFDGNDESDGGRQIEGTWILTVTPPFGAPSFLAISSYARGGVLVTTPDRLPPNLGNTINDALGSWRATGHRTFVSTHVEFRYGPMGNVIGTVKLRASTRITKEDAFEGVGQLQLCDATFDHCSPPSPTLSTVMGRRLPAEPPIVP